MSVRGPGGVLRGEQLSFGLEPVLDVMSVLTAARLKQLIRAVADGLRRDAGDDVPRDGALIGSRDFLYHLNPPMLRLLRSRRMADVPAPRALLEKARFDEVPKQYLT